MLTRKLTRKMFGNFQKKQLCATCHGIGRVNGGANLCGNCGGTGFTRNKFNRTRVVIDGVTYDSKKEANKAVELNLLKKAGEIQDWIAHPQYVIAPRFRDEFTGKIVLPIKYFPDFWVKYNDGHEEVIDIKGFPTPDFKLKAKLFRAKYNGKIKLVIE